MSRDLLRQPLLRSAIAIVAAIWLLGGAAEHAWHAATSLDQAHGAVASASGPLAVNADHAQCESGLSPSCPGSVAVVDLPRWDIGFLVLGLSAAAVVLVCCLDRMRQTKRGPPRGSPMPITGQDLLTRFCLARR